MKVPIRFVIGLILIAVFWYLNWSLEGLRTHLGFFPLWLGFALTLDALVYLRKGHSLFTRNKIAYIGLYLLSVPVWWLFELFNQVTHNWQYIGREHFSDGEYFILASLSFSTVIPSVFAAAEFVSTFIKNKNHSLKIDSSKNLGVIFIVIGFSMIVLLLLFPNVFYVFIWMAVFFIVEGINVLFENDGIVAFISKGNWKPVFALSIGCLICGFFWEMWNYYSYPKWVYDVPGVNFLHVFEMPVLGYLGYIPFSLELYSIYILFINLIGKKELNNYIDL